jgi:hypothetical protein
LQIEDSTGADSLSESGLKRKSETVLCALSFLFARDIILSRKRAQSKEEGAKNPF